VAVIADIQHLLSNILKIEKMFAGAGLVCLFCRKNGKYFSYKF
jgi:hypothetical protein